VLRVVRGPKKDDGASVDFLLPDMPKGMKIASAYDVNAVAGALAYLVFDDVARESEKDFTKATVTEIVTLDGVRAVVKTVPAEEDKKAWITIAASYDAALAKPDDGNKDLLAPGEAEKQVNEAMRRMTGWTYLVSESMARDLTRKQADLIEPEKQDEKKG
jgi:hypothetical protein